MSECALNASAARKVLRAAAFFLLVAGPAAAEQIGDVKSGLELYSTYCVICHGTNMVNSGARSYDLRKFPLDARDRFFKSVKKGKRDMPAWADLLNEQMIEDLWAYVKTRGK